jgi:Family of unknown function (DUF5681)
MPKQLFVKGQSGNPKGKPRGVRHTATQISYALMEGNLEEVLATVIERAKGGDMTACKMVLDKVLPNTKDRPIALEIPLINDLNDVGNAQAEILQAVASGSITPNEGERVASIIEARRRSIETIDLEARISQLEGR